MKLASVSALNAVRIGLLLLLGGAVLGLAPTPQHAESRSSHATAYSDAHFERASAQGKIIVVEAYADWCAPCRAQAPILAGLRRERRFSNMVILRVDENSPAEDWRRFRLAGFGSIVVHRGSREVARGNPTTEEAMRALLSRAL